MEQINSGSNNKRSFKEFMAQELAGKYRGKSDFYDALDKHGKFNRFTC